MIHWINKILKLSFVVIVFLKFTMIGDNELLAEEKHLQVLEAAKLSLKQGISMSLEDCVKFAVENGYEVRLAKLDLLIAETDLMYSQSVYDAYVYGGANYTEDKRQQLSVFSPDDNRINVYNVGIGKTFITGTKVDLGLEDTRTWSNTSFVAKNPAHEAEFTLSLEQPIGKNSFGYIDRKNITLTKLAIENSGLDTKDRIEALIVEVEKAYYSLMHERKRVEVYRNILLKAKELYERDKKSFDVGIKERVDLAASESNLATLEAELLLAINSFRSSETALKLVMNMPEKEHIVTKGYLGVSASEKTLEECLKEAFTFRRDYQISKQNADIRGIELEINSNKKWPEIDLTASVANNGLDKELGKALRTATVLDNTSYYAGIEVNLPIENRAAESDYLKSRYGKEKALIEMKSTERNIVKDVTDNFRVVISYKQALAYMKKALDLQGKKLEEEEKSFKHGRSTTKKIIDYQQDLLRASLEVNRYLLNYNIARAGLERSMAVVLDKYKDIL